MSEIDEAADKRAIALTVASPPARGDQDMLSNPEAFEHGQRVARVFASAELVPAHMRGKLADCFIALNIARRMGEDPITVMQNIHFISGRAGWKTEYMLARAYRCGVFRDRIVWRTEGSGRDMRVTASATLAANGQHVSAEASMAMAEAEGWTKNPKYRSMPEHMLRWRSATMLIRLYAPEVMLGLPMRDEIEDISYAEAAAPASPRPASRLDAIEAALTTDDHDEIASPPEPEVPPPADLDNPGDVTAAAIPAEPAADGAQPAQRSMLPPERLWHALPPAKRAQIEGFLAELAAAGTASEYWSVIDRHADMLGRLAKAYPAIASELKVEQQDHLVRVGGSQ